MTGIPDLRTAPGLGLLLTGGPQPDDWAASAAAFAALEERGASALWLADHLFWGRPMPEPLTLAAVAATATRRCAIGTGVLQLPMRRTAAVAKAATTLQAISAGRFVLGVGVGEHAEEYRRAGVDFADRGHRLDAGIAALQELWAPADTGWFEQRPAPTPIPIWVGGRSAAAIERAARAADGWMPIFVSPEQYRTALASLDDALASHDRRREAVVRAVTLVVAVAETEAAVDDAARWCGALWNLPVDRVRRHLVAGPPTAIAEAVARYREIGAEHVSILPATDDPVALFEALAPT